MVKYNKYSKKYKINQKKIKNKSKKINKSGKKNNKKNRNFHSKKNLKKNKIKKIKHSPNIRIGNVGIGNIDFLKKLYSNYKLPRGYIKPILLDIPGDKILNISKDRLDTIGTTIIKNVIKKATYSLISRRFDKMARVVIAAKSGICPLTT